MEVDQVCSALQEASAVPPPAGPTQQRPASPSSRGRGAPARTTAEDVGPSQTKNSEGPALREPPVLEPMFVKPSSFLFTHPQTYKPKGELGMMDSIAAGVPPVTSFLRTDAASPDSIGKDAFRSGSRMGPKQKYRIIFGRSLYGNEYDNCNNNNNNNNNDSNINNNNNRDCWMDCDTAPGQIADDCSIDPLGLFGRFQLGTAWPPGPPRGGGGVSRGCDIQFTDHLQPPEPSPPCASSFNHCHSSPSTLRFVYLPPLPYSHRPFLSSSPQASRSVTCCAAHRT